MGNLCFSRPAISDSQRKQQIIKAADPGAYGNHQTNNGSPPSRTAFIHNNNNSTYTNDVWLPSRDAPGFSNFARDNNSSYTDDDNIPNLDDDDASLTTTCLNTLRRCFFCLSKRNWPQILSVSEREGPIVKQMTYPETISILVARSKMSVHTVDYLVLVDSNLSLTGIVTKKDLPESIHIAVEDNTPVSKVMTKNPSFVYSDTPALEAVHKMAKGNFETLPVIENGKFIGLLTQQLCQYHIYQESYGEVLCRIEPAMAAIAQWNFG